MHHSLIAGAALSGLLLLPAASAQAAPAGAPQQIESSSALGSAELTPSTGCQLDEGTDIATPAVTSGGVFSDARDAAHPALWISPAVSGDGVFSDARDLALSRLMQCPIR